MARTVGDWLGRELDRIWLAAETCFRQLAGAGLRPAAAGDLAAILHARGDRPVDDLERALTHADRDVLARRAGSPVAALGLDRLEAETFVLALAPHIDPAIVELFAAVRGARRAVNLALVIQLHRLAREARAALLGVLDPARPLLAHQLIEIGPLATGAASATSRPIHPTFIAIELVSGRAATSAQVGSPHAHYGD